MAIEVINKQRLMAVPARRLATLAEAVLKAVRRPGNSLTIALVRDRSIRDLNRKYRGKDSTTDVLSFAVSAAGDFLGDIVISTDMAARQAADAGHPLDRELSELVIHGALHLCGYDHETDRGEMNRLELKLRRRLLD